MIRNYILGNAIEGDMKVFYHLVYEYEKGVRNFVLYTMEKQLIPLAIRKLNNHGIQYFVREIEGSPSANLFFGQQQCVKAMQSILRNKSIDDLSPEEDFILGSILGYDLCRQCERYCNRKTANEQLKLRSVETSLA